jgi:hypothetical protein
MAPPVCGVGRILFSFQGAGWMLLGRVARSCGAEKSSNYSPDTFMAESPRSRTAVGQNGEKTGFGRLRRAETAKTLTGGAEKVMVRGL